MSTAELVNRHVWFVTNIYNRGPISLEEIQHRFESHCGRGEELSERQFHRVESSTCKVESYCVTLVEQRWYMLGMSDKLRIYYLDRIKALEPTERKFMLPEKFDAVKFFEDYYSVIIGDEDCDVEPVALNVDSWQSKYLRTLPLRNTQEEVECNEEYSILEYRLSPTFDFQQKLLSMGDSMGVLASMAPKDMIRKKVETTANNNASASMGLQYHFKVYKK